MKKSSILLLVLWVAILSVHGCKTVPEKKPGLEPVEPVEPVEPERVREYNFRLVTYDESIAGPDEDQRSYYRVYVDKVDIGRTTIGLESQKKYFEAKLTHNRHLLILEKWVLDTKKERYVKVNNIHQPRPNYVYFEIDEGTMVEVTMVYDVKERKAAFTISKDD
ncbi:MAG: hypothetical protein ACOCXW_02115 [Bacteroidota bacterium]